MPSESTSGDDAPTRPEVAAVAPVRVTYQGRPHLVREDQTLLEALLAGGEAIASSCRAGACGACLVQATAGDIPAAAQAGLRDSWKERGYLYSCVCRPIGALALEPLGDGARVAARIVERTPLSASVTRVHLRLEGTLSARAGQYVTLHRDGIARSYSIAAMREPHLLELHVRHLPGGALSPSLCLPPEPDAPAGAWMVQGPLGDCVYLPGRPEQPLLLAGTGTGLAPLWGVLNDALAAGHTGPIHLFHGAVDPRGLYLVEELSSLAIHHPQLRYTPSVLRDAAEGPPGIEQGTLEAVIARHLPKTSGMRAFVCGDPAIVALLKKKLFLSGTALREIAADAFLPAAGRAA
jgi:CDP-4-dehydro-6-deoxyglucose reductase, E3